MENPVMKWLNKRKPVVVQKVLAFGKITKGRTARICAGGYEFSEGYTHQMKVPKGIDRRHLGKRIITCAAIYVHWRDEDGKEHKRIYAAPRPKRHHDVFMVMRNEGVKIEITDIIDIVQGFNTSDDGFVDRRIGFHVARNAGQIIKKHGPADTLFSEDMW